MTESDLAQLLPESERDLVNLIRKTPLWHVTASDESRIDVTKDDVTFRFSPADSPLIVAPVAPDGYPLTLANLLWRCARYQGTWWHADWLWRAADWQRTTVADYRPGWAEVARWMLVAPSQSLTAARRLYEQQRPLIHTDEDAAKAASAIHDAVNAITQHRLSGFISHLDEPQATVAAQMLADGLEITTFWGPEQMDVWRLDLARGPVHVRFGIERGASYGIEVNAPRLRDRGTYYGWAAYSTIALVWAARTGALPEQVDTLDLHATTDYTASREVLEWLSEATDADLSKIDAVIDLVYHHANSEHRAIID
ncbi:MAG: hypothetical protein ABI435_01245, partial [Pseudolysinimonas sp.]